MKIKFALLFLVLGFLSFRFSEKIMNTIEQQINLPDEPYNYTDITIPTHLSTNALFGPLQNAATDNDNTPATNPTTDDGATLGRVLFYDKNLSANQTTSCASCHKQEDGFSDSNVLSIGFAGGTTRRHSMGLTNAVWYDRGKFFWDERAASLEDQVLDPFQDPVEMGMTLEGVISAVEEQNFYPALFEKAFGSTEINSDRVSKALAQFIRSMVSVNSKYDEGRAGVNIPTASFSNFTDSENNGKNLFFRPKSVGGLSCVGCHSTEAFINPDAGTTNNGLDLESTDDLGVFEAIPNNAFLGTFKVPSLKNIALTAPYMHDGRFATLEEVVEHYNSGVKNHPNLNSSLKDDGVPQQLNLSDQDKTDLVNFLKTLTDETMVNDVKFSDPFISAQCQEEVVCNDNFAEDNTLSAAKYISANGTIATSNTVIFEAGDSIVLKPGFAVAAGATFTAQIKACTENALVSTIAATQRNTLNSTSDLSITSPTPLDLTIYPNPSMGNATVLFELSEDSPVNIHLFDHSGRLLQELLVAKKLSAGRHELAISEALYSGLFYVVLQTPTAQVTQKMVVLK